MNKKQWLLLRGENITHYYLSAFEIWLGERGVALQEVLL
jgi:hypothetical protein